jgi:hypothetical protein
VPGRRRLDTDTDCAAYQRGPHSKQLPPPQRGPASTLSRMALARYGDRQSEAKNAFIEEARRRYAKPIPTIENEVVSWYCGSCGQAFSVEDVLIEEESRDPEPVCGVCDASGWETVRPQVA